MAQLPSVTYENYLERVNEAQKGWRIQFPDSVTDTLSNCLKEENRFCEICNKKFTCLQTLSTHLKSRKHLIASARCQLESRNVDKSRKTDEKNNMIQTEQEENYINDSVMEMDSEDPVCQKNESEMSADGYPWNTSQCIFCSYISSTCEKYILNSN